MILSRLRRLRDAYALDELIVLGLILSVFLTIYATVVSLAAVLVYLILKKRLLPILFQTPKALYLLAFGALTLLVSVLYRNERGILSAFGLAVMLLIALYIRSVMTVRLFEAALNVSCAASLVSVAVITMQLLLDPGGVEIRAASTFLNANFYGTIVEIVVLFCVYKSSQATPRGKFVYRAILAANLAGLYMSNSRTAMIALGLAVLFFFAVRRQKRGVLTAAAASLAFVLVISQLPVMQDRLSAVGTDLQFRIDIWRTALRGIADTILVGRGGGSYILTCIRSGGPIQAHAHNLFFELLLNFGLAGVLLLAIYFRSNLSGIIRLRDEPGDNSIRHLVNSVIFCMMIHGITDVTLSSLQTALLFTLVMGAAGIREHALRPVPVYRPVRAIRIAQAADRSYPSAPRR